MSEAEQHWMRLRLEGGKQSKARRGELPLRAPPGYQWDYQQARFRLDPDERVRKVVRLIFERFRIEGIGRAVVRYFAEQGLKMPSMDTRTWKMRFIAPDKNPVMTILRSPVYALCGLCGRRMHVKYQGRHHQAQYQCVIAEDSREGKQKMCFNVSATRIDQVVANHFFEALGPREVELGFAVFQHVERQADGVKKQWSLQLNQAEYEATLAERRYKAVDPDNRVVARTLERDWNDKLALWEDCRPTSTST